MRRTSSESLEDKDFERGISSRFCASFWTLGFVFGSVQEKELGCFSLKEFRYDHYGHFCIGFLCVIFLVIVDFKR